VATLHADAHADSTVPRRMTWAEICALYPDEWVVLVDLEHEDGDDDDGEVVAGVVVGHSKGHAACLVDSKPLRPPGTNCAHLFTGEIIPLPLSVRFP